MGAERDLIRVVFDTNTVVSALLFRGELSWLGEHWRSGTSTALISRAVALADAGRADVLVTGDKDLLTLQDQIPFVIETPALFRARFA